MAAKRSTLGRGISAILEEVEEAYASDLRENQDSIIILPIDEVAPNPFQPRTQFDAYALNDLAASIKTHGLLQPIVVIKNDGKFVLIAGERRLRASKIAGQETIRAVVADAQYDKLRELALIENIQRENLNPLELAKSFNELIDLYSLTHEALAEIVGKSRAYVTNILRLLQLGDYAKQALVDQRISYGHGKVLVGLPSDQERKIVDSIANQKLSVRETEALLQKFRQTKNEREIEPRKPAAINFGDMITTLNARGIAAKRHSNQLVISFDTQEACNLFLEWLEKG